jgi:hypothetical protein
MKTYIQTSVSQEKKKGKHWFFEGTVLVSFRIGQTACAICPTD